MAFTLPDLPYAKDALAPHLSQETLEYHHDKHHNAYVTNLNGLIEGTDNAGKSLEDIIAAADGPLFNNAAQVWNHTFYWNCMKPGGGGAPSGELAKAMDAAFGSFDDFKKELSAAAVGAIRLRLGLVGAGERRTEGHQDQQCRPAPQARADRAADRGCVGARVLHRLSEPAAQVRRDLLDEPGELGLRRRRTTSAPAKASR